MDNLGVSAGREESTMLGQNTKVHSSGLGDSIPVDLPLFPLAVTCMDGAPRDQSTSSDRETSPGTLTEKPAPEL